MIMGHELDESELDQRFTRYYKNGQRVEVTYTWDSGETEKERFYIGKSTGWKPIYIALKRVDSIGGCGIMSRPITHIRPIDRFLGRTR